MDIDMDINSSFSAASSSSSSEVMAIDSSSSNKKKKKKKKCKPIYIPPSMDDKPELRVGFTGIFQYFNYYYITNEIIHRIIRMNSVKDINRFMNCSRKIQNTYPMSCFIPLRTGDDCSEDRCFHCNGTKFIRTPDYRCANPTCFKGKEEHKKDYTLILGYELIWSIINNQLRYYRNNKLTNPRELFDRLNTQLRNELRKMTKLAVRYGWGSLTSTNLKRIMIYHEDLKGKFNETYWTVLMLQILEVFNLYLRDNITYIFYFIPEEHHLQINTGGEASKKRFVEELSQFGHLIKHFRNVRDVIFNAPGCMEFSAFSFRLLADYSEVKQLTCYAPIGTLLSGYRDFYSLQTVILHNFYPEGVKDICIDLYVKCPNLNNVELHYKKEDGFFGRRKGKPEFIYLLQTCKHIQNAVINGNSDREVWLGGCNYDRKNNKIYPFKDEQQREDHKRPAIDSLPAHRLKYLELIKISTTEPIFYRTLALLFPKIEKLVMSLSNNKIHLLAMLKKLTPETKQQEEEYMDIDYHNNILRINMIKIRELVDRTTEDDWMTPSTFPQSSMFNDLPDAFNFPTGGGFSYPQFNNPNVQNNHNYNTVNAGFQSTWNLTMANAFPGQTWVTSPSGETRPTFRFP